VHDGARVALQNFGDIGVGERVGGRIVLLECAVRAVAKQRIDFVSIYRSIVQRQSTRGNWLYMQSLPRGVTVLTPLFDTVALASVSIFCNTA
jgi:hypothetical protein